ncbi:hypothetical protein [Mycobacterium intracellulare]|uniref:hypothetical protein n=1 Tax=Mycobacterium intracellulare TaxID=1767 RepID=UPI001EEF5C80|nr:hypothetical protein [Mycobacterium intracellulare]MEE3751975.1 hypothetical protein [Mycobacterium intracellulare]
MLTERGLVMTHRGTGTAAPGTVIEAAPGQQTGLLLGDDAEVSVLMAEVDAILCAASVTLLRRPPAPPVAGCALLGPRSPGRSWEVCAPPWRAPAPNVRAVQRSPPRRPSANPDDTTMEKGR